MEKGKKTEALNKNIQAQEGVATRLQRHIDTITGYLATIGDHWTKLGSELKAIRDEGDYAGTFEEFVKSTFGKTRSWAYQFIQGYEAKLALPQDVQASVQTPWQAVAIASAPFEKRPKILKAVKDRGNTSSRAIIAETKKEAAKEAEVVELDELGKKIPAEILPEWNRAKGEAKIARDSINVVARWFRDGLGDGEGKKRDPIFRSVTLSNKKLFDDIKRQIAMVDPYCLCPTCKGTQKHEDKKCPHCKGTGFISKFEHEHTDKKGTK